MKVITALVPEVKLVPRSYPLITDNLTLAFEDGTLIPFTWILQGNVLNLTLNSTTGFVQGSYYSFILKNGSEIIYMGKMLFVKNGTDIQNYTNQSQDNKRWK